MMCLLQNIERFDFPSQNSLPVYHFKDIIIFPADIKKRIFVIRLRVSVHYYRPATFAKIFRYDRYEK